ncbi:hypothetical protein N7519_008261 [Penicillium mononematosum]|uniref:uncharacterized protein n=1 Tax=Penicillium mononematosum TaxID=268346 RepID=UPI002548782D|nr:uncharacterized protein N7519_008261 [Penicillium mononematosum]KAJ6177800.1 hypothetical protein N7519_008261 [Penicillium mononematosum]
MSSPGFPRDPVDDDPKASIGGPKTTADSSQRAKSQRDALVSLNNVVRKLILERNGIENEIVRQRAVLADQVARLSATDENIESLQKVWEDMAAGFGLQSKK